MFKVISLRRLLSKSANFAFIAVIGMVCTNAGYAKPGEALQLAPSSKWRVDYAESTCTLMREFGEGDEKVTLLLDRMEPSDSARMTIYGKKLILPLNEDALKIEFEPNGNEQQISYFKGKMADGQPAILVLENMRIRALNQNEKDGVAKNQKEKSFVPFKLIPITEAEEMAITELKIGRPLRHPVTLQTGSMGKAFRALRDCTDNLVRYWGFDPAKRLTLQREVTPKSSPGNWISTLNYPVSEISRGGRGIVNFRMDIDASGKATKCEVLQSASSPEFKRAVCLTLMKNAEFNPALDADGNPISWYWRNTVVFQLPSEAYPNKSDFRTG